MLHNYYKKLHHLHKVNSTELNASPIVILQNFGNKKLVLFVDYYPLSISPKVERFTLNPPANAALEIPHNKMQNPVDH